MRMRQIVIQTPEQIERLREIQKAVGDYQAALATAKTARKSIKDLMAEANEIQFGPRKEKTPEAMAKALDRKIARQQSVAIAKAEAEKAAAKAKSAKPKA